MHPWSGQAATPGWSCLVCPPSASPETSEIPAQLTKRWMQNLMCKDGIYFWTLKCQCVLLWLTKKETPDACGWESRGIGLQLHCAGVCSFSLSCTREISAFRSHWKQPENSCHYIILALISCTWLCFCSVYYGLSIFLLCSKNCTQNIESLFSVSVNLLIDILLEACANSLQKGINERHRWKAKFDQRAKFCQKHFIFLCYWDMTRCLFITKCLHWDFSKPRWGKLYLIASRSAVMS